jgi:hypothetical protein
LRKNRAAAPSDHRRRQNKNTLEQSSNHVPASYNESVPAQALRTHVKKRRKLEWREKAAPAARNAGILPVVFGKVAAFDL